jgi:hypothetical protein
MSENLPLPPPPTPTQERCGLCLNTPCTCKACPCCQRKAPSEDFCTACLKSTFYACCACWQCQHCQKSYDEATVKACQNCGWCTTNCCRCTRCTHCNRVRNGDNFCETCHFCESCCGCGIGIELINPTPEPTFFIAQKTEHKQNPSNRLISMEIEVASVAPGTFRPVQQAIQKWKGAVVHDGSLPETGFEINTSPASGDKFIEQISEICDALKEQKGKITDACGLHVHVDARNFDYYDIRKLVFFYAKIEDALFGMCQRRRRDSEFCFPCGAKLVKDLESHRAPKDNRKKLLENVYGREVNVATVRREKRNPARYNALNLHSCLYRGTVEFRGHHGSMDKADIVNWGILWASILDFVYNNSESEVKAMKGDGMKLLQEISPSQTVRAYIAERTEYFRNHSR